jgi:hypothetical protein
LTLYEWLKGRSDRIYREHGVIASREDPVDQIGWVTFNPFDFELPRSEPWEEPSDYEPWPEAVEASPMELFKGINSWLDEMERKQQKRCAAAVSLNRLKEEKGDLEILSLAWFLWKGLEPPYHLAKKFPKALISDPAGSMAGHGPRVDFPFQD